MHNRISSRWGVLVSALLFVAACAPRPRAVDPGRLTSSAAERGCFDLRDLAPDERRDAERLLLAFGDREGLYTLAGGLKPISSDVGDLSIRIAPTLDTAALSALDRQRRVAAALRCGDIGFTVEVFTATQKRRDSSEVRATSMVVYHRGAVRRTVEAHRAFFATLGVTPSTDPREVLSAVENAPRAPRWRGYGYLFGYPDDAVDFFVQAGEEGDRIGSIVPRDFRRIDTYFRFASNEGPMPTFVFAVPKGSAPSAAEQALRAAAAPIYARYTAERAQRIRADSSGALALWQRWLTSGAGPTRR